MSNNETSTEFIRDVIRGGVALAFISMVIAVMIIDHVYSLNMIGSTIDWVKSLYSLQ